MNAANPRSTVLRPAGPALLLAAVLLVLALLALTVSRSLPESSLGADAPAERFSEARARAVLERILSAAGHGPHPVGSPASPAVQEAVRAEAAALGLSVTTQPGFACGDRWGGCGAVSNLILRVPGRDPALKSVLLSTHHDSVGAGPGAADAGASVAACLEIARALLAGEPPERGVTILINDGEEAGLLGSRVFLEQVGGEEVFAVVNLEARGTSGPSAMFETGPGNAAFVEAWSREVPRPVSSSTLYSLYRLLPSDTDLTVYSAAGLPGLNFAFADGHPRYHTPLDTLEHLDPRSLQHQGENALAAVRALASLPDEARAGGDVAWLDLLSSALVAWPLSWNLPLAGIALLLAAAGLALAAARGLAVPRELGWAAGGVLGGLLLALAAGEGLVRALQALRGDARPWTAHPEWATTAVAAAAAFVVLAVAALLARRCGAWAWWSSAALLLSVGGGLLAWRLPGTAPHALIPALGVSATLLLGALLPRLAGTNLLLLGLAIAAWPWLALAYALHVMVSLDLSVAVSLPAAVLATIAAAAAPVEHHRWSPALAALAIALIAWSVASIVPRYSRELPRHANLLHVEHAGRGEAWWLATGNPPEELLAALAAEPAEVPDFPWPGRTNRLDVAAAEPAGSPPPELEVLERIERDFGRTLRLRLRSLRGADVAELRVPMEARLRAARIQGLEAPVRAGATQRLQVRGLPAAGVVIDLDLETQEPATIAVADRLRELPPSGARLRQARPPNAVPAHDGDVSIVFAVVELP